MRKWEYLYSEVEYAHISSSDPTFKEGFYITRIRSNEETIFDSYDFRTRQKYDTRSLTLYPYLADMGAEGWELVTMVNLDEKGLQRELIFKRPLD